MEDSYPFNEFNVEAVVEDKYSSSNNDFWNAPLDHHHHQVPENVKKISEAEEWGDSGVGLDSFCSNTNNIDFFPDHHYYSTQEDCLLSFTNPHKEKLPILDYGSLDNLRFDMVISSPVGDNRNNQIPAMADFSLSNKNFQHQNSPLPLASLDLLNNYGLKRFFSETEQQDHDNHHHHHHHHIHDFTTRNKKLSTEEIIKIAATMFIQSSSSSSTPYDYHYSHLSSEEKEDIKLASSLLSSAEKVGAAQFERATLILDHCESQSSLTGNALKRVVSYFCEALRERINRETGRKLNSTPKVYVQGEIPNHYQKFKNENENGFSLFDPDDSMKNPGPTMISCHIHLPFCHVVNFAGIQSILEKFNDSTRIHVIDLGIKFGSQWTILMQALALRTESPIEILKITALGYSSEKDSLNETGNRLIDFAKSMNVNFKFHTVTVSDMKDLSEEMFILEKTETIAVYSMFALRPLISESVQLEWLMKVIRNVKPVVMVMIEVEANHNSRVFVERFTEALFYFGAFFDCVEELMGGDEVNRRVLESFYFRCGIRDIVGVEGEKRKIRNVKIDVWRKYLGRFGMVEEELSMSSLYQAEMVAKTFSGGGFCTFHVNGKSLLCGWKGTPIFSLSVWKFL